MRKDEMLSYLPPHLSGSVVIGEIMAAEGQEHDCIYYAIEDIEAQFDIDTATWGLDIYEKELGIITDHTKPTADRRAVVKSKLRIAGKVDKLLIKVVADAYTNGQVEVNFDGHIKIYFTSQIGIPPNLQDLKSVLEEIKPAHLAIDYILRYLLISEVSAMSISQLEQITLDKFAGGE